MQHSNSISHEILSVFLEHSLSGDSHSFWLGHSYPRKYHVSPPCIFPEESDQGGEETLYLALWRVILFSISREEPRPREAKRKWEAADERRKWYCFHFLPGGLVGRAADRPTPYSPFMGLLTWLFPGLLKRPHSKATLESCCWFVSQIYNWQG
jgi:hypothetical protein